MGVTDAEQLGDWIAVGELALDARIVPSPGVLLAAIHASEAEVGLICPSTQGSEARWASEVPVCAAPDLASSRTARCCWQTRAGPGFWRS